MKGIHVPDDPDAPKSILTDVGLSGYRNRWEGQTLHYMGEGRSGDQQPVGGNAELLSAWQKRYAVRVFEKLARNQWVDRGLYRVAAYHYQYLDEERRRAFEFVLEPVGPVAQAPDRKE
ncbi:MAG: hypothetical protein HY335_08885 [Deinococcus sp.]|nr:hypothetical protein [Deinococcus sp.]